MPNDGWRESCPLLPDNQKLVFQGTWEEHKVDWMGRRPQGREQIFKMSTFSKLAKTLVKIHVKDSISLIKLNSTNV